MTIDTQRLRELAQKATPERVPRATKINIAGMTFGRLTVLYRVGQHKKYGVMWKCTCSCGNETVAGTCNLRGGKTKSCGCLRTEARSISGKNNKKHGHAVSGVTSQTYKSWRSMMSRCYQETNISFKYYGMKGISVCDRWHDFANFVADMGERPDGKSIDRINLSGNYEPINCRWATQKEQQNNRSTNVLISFNGKTQTLGQWASELGINKCTLQQRIAHGWSEDKAISTPVRRRPVKGRHNSEIAMNKLLESLK